MEVLILAVVSIALQTLILTKTKAHDYALSLELFDGVLFSSNLQRLKKATIFLYNPVLWKHVKSTSIRLLLSVNFLIVMCILYQMFVA